MWIGVGIWVDVVVVLCEMDGDERSDPAWCVCLAGPGVVWRVLVRRGQLDGQSCDSIEAESQWDMSEDEV